MGIAPEYHMKAEDLAPLAPILTQLIENSGIELGTMDLLQAGFAEMMGQYGVNLKDVRVMKTLLNPEALTTENSVKAEPRYRYDAGFPDPHPDNHGELITLKAFLGRDWKPATHSRYADEDKPELDQFSRPVGGTRVTHDASSIFRDTDVKPQSVSAKRELAKRQEEEREQLAAQARQRRAAGQ
jgi:hypothetical protein